MVQQEIILKWGANEEQEPEERENKQKDAIVCCGKALSSVTCPLSASRRV